LRAVEAHSPRDGCEEQAARIVDVAVVVVYSGVRGRCFWRSDMTCCGESGVGLKNVTRACEDLHPSTMLLVVPSTLTHQENVLTVERHNSM
jgi:hypothetical protein